MKILSGNSLKSAVTKDKPLIILYYMNGCGHCDNFKPVWKECCNQLKTTDGIMPGEIEYSNINILPKNLQNVMGFPTVQVIEKRKIVAEYEGNRTKDDVLNFAKKHGVKIKTKTKTSIKKPKTATKK